MIQKTLITDVHRCIKAKNVAELNGTISNYLADNNINMTVDEWKVANCKMLRGWAYPDPVELIDSLVKIHAENYPQVQAEGQAEINDVVEQIRQIKQFFPSS